VRCYFNKLCSVQGSCVNCIHDLSKLGILKGKYPNLIRRCKVQFALLLLIGMCLVLMNYISGVAIPTEMKLECVMYVVCTSMYSIGSFTS